VAALPAFLERLHARGDARALALGARLCRGALAPLAAHVERCFWALCPSVPGPAARRRGLLAMSAAALAAARALAAAADPGPDPAGAAALLGACAALLGERGALAADGGAFLKGCVRGLCAELRRLPAGPGLDASLDASQEPPDARAAAAAEAAAVARGAAEGALAQCLHALFGVDMPQRDADWAGGWPARTLPPQRLPTSEVCKAYVHPAAWHHVLYTHAVSTGECLPHIWAVCRIMLNKCVHDTCVSAECVAEEQMKTGRWMRGRAGGRGGAHAAGDGRGRPGGLAPAAAGPGGGAGGRAAPGAPARCAAGCGR